MLDRLLTEHDHILKTLNLLEKQFLDLCRGGSPDYSLMRSIIVYIQEYPEQAHHPLEDMIFSILLERLDDGRQIQKLITDHTDLETVTRELRKSLELLKKGEISEEELKQKLSQFLVRQRQHLYVEEKKVYPLVKRHITTEDWDHIRSVIPPLDDPVFGERTRSDYERLYREIEDQGR
ncbi:MAG: hemerythrin domain-containing protein [Proteobacteria bacterium]|nr:hemerythrin domain-containing protein [Pseudomonadota bacterium]